MDMEERTRRLLERVQAAAKRDGKGKVQMFLVRSPKVPDELYQRTTGLSRPHKMTRRND